MRKSALEQAWVVYRVSLRGVPTGAAVCGQSEWDAMERAEPGRHALIRGGIASEAEAEALARESSGFVPPGPRAGNYRPARSTPGPKRATWRDKVHGRAPLPEGGR